MPHDLAFRTGAFSGANCEWDTIGKVPDSAGLYAFVLTNDDRQCELRIAYVGKTKNLWMITKGRLPRNGGARGPQRYGRWKHAGETRARVNGLVTEAKRSGWDLAHWLSARPVDDIALHEQEEELIELWNLRTAGWNRGKLGKGDDEQEPLPASSGWRPQMTPSWDSISSHVVRFPVI